MVSTLNLNEKFNRVRRNFCFYLDIQDRGLSLSLSRRIEDMGLQQEVFLTSRVTHVVRSRPAPCSPAAGARWAPARREWRARADAMLERVPAHHSPHSAHSPHSPNARYVQLTVQKAISLLDKLYTFFTASRKAHVTHFTKHFIKIEFLDKLCRPIYKEFDEWPEISLEPDPPKEKKKETPEKNTNQTTKDLIQKMTRKTRPRIKEREEKEIKGGYCEMCNTEYVDAALHRRSPHHLAFVRDHANFLALDSLIGAGADVSAFLDKATPVNGERRSLRNMCNGDIDQPKNRRSMRSQSPDSTMNGNQSPRRNGGLDDEKKHNTRCSKRVNEPHVEDRQYYKVVGVSTKLRSSGGFTAKRKDSPPPCNGTKPLVVKFRKVRRSELSVLSDEAEQFMFPKRASSTSSTSSDEEEDDENGEDDDEEDDVDKQLSPRRKCTPPPPPPIINERRRQARPLALKEESSEDDSWPEDKRRRKKRPPAVVKRARRVQYKAQSVETPQVEPAVITQLVPAEITVPPPTPVPEVSPLREEPVEKCMKWEDGKLKYTPAVEQLEFAFECVPQSEPWFETFKRQDEDKVLTRNVPKYFALYSKSPKLPYEIGQLPPLKPNCCPLSDLVKREDKPGPSRSYGTRGMKKQKIRKRTAALQALEGHPRKSPREHASTLAILGSAGLLHRRKHPDDTKSTASEDTVSDTHCNLKIEPLISETQEASERLQQFLSEVFEDAAEFDISEEVMDGEAAVATSTNLPDVSSLVSECENCDLIRNEIKEAADRPRRRRGKFKKKNRTGWPNKRKQTKNSSRTSSFESETKADSSLDRSSVDDDTTQGTISEEDANLSEPEKEKPIGGESSSEGSQDKTLAEVASASRRETTDSTDAQDATLREEKAVQVEEEAEQKARSSETEDGDGRRRAARRALAGLGGLADWLQPVVRVARVDPAAARRLRSAARPRSARLR
ncbi:unnamed protein product [Arctia plantaginis]|uniref:DBF4-type domain-containing protein n=1 Tax=Arctia plantaginis TaxID=874455 RepID=A0A8S0Z4F4_ARCPL|nr:unnamed protein product [Arctia plantaginis]